MTASAAVPLRTVLNVDESLPAQCHAAVKFDKAAGVVSFARSERCSIKHECNVDDVFFSSEKEFDLWQDVLQGATKELWDGENISLVLHGPAQNMSLFSSSGSGSSSSSGAAPAADQHSPGGASSTSSGGGGKLSAPASLSPRPTTAKARTPRSHSPRPGSSVPHDTALHKILRALLMETRHREVPQHYKASVCIGAMLMDFHGNVSDVGTSFDRAPAISDGDGDAVTDGFGETHRMLMFPVKEEAQLHDFSTKLSAVCEPVMNAPESPMLLISVKLIQECSISPSRASYIRIAQIMNSSQSVEELMLAVTKTKQLSAIATNISKAALDRVSGSSQVVFVQSCTPDTAVDVFSVVAAGKGSLVRTELNNATTDVASASHTFVLRRVELRSQLRDLKADVKELKMALKQQQNAVLKAKADASAGSMSPLRAASMGQQSTASTAREAGSPHSAAGETAAGGASPTSGLSTPRAPALAGLDAQGDDEGAVKLEERRFAFQQQAQMQRRRLLGRISVAQEEVRLQSSHCIELRKAIAAQQQRLAQDRLSYAESLAIAQRTAESRVRDSVQRSDTLLASGVPRPVTALSFLKAAPRLSGNISLPLPMVRVKAATPATTAMQLRQVIEAEGAQLAAVEQAAKAQRRQCAADAALYRLHVSAMAECCRGLHAVYQIVEPIAQTTSSYLCVDVPKGHHLVQDIVRNLVTVCLAAGDPTNTPVKLKLHPDDVRFEL